MICPLVVLEFTELPNSGWAKAHAAHLLAALLHYAICLIEMAEPGRPPDFGSSVNPISTKGAYYAPRISTRPPDFSPSLI